MRIRHVHVHRLCTDRCFSGQFSRSRSSFCSAVAPAQPMVFARAYRPMMLKQSGHKRSYSRSASRKFLTSLVVTCAYFRQYTHNYEEDRRWLMKDWRCELTALSQLYNLYFIACNDTILVYQPDFPDQS